MLCDDIALFVALPPRDVVCFRYCFGLVLLGGRGGSFERGDEHVDRDSDGLHMNAHVCE